MRPVNRMGYVLVVILVVHLMLSLGVSAAITKVFIVPMSHLDIGFTATPREVSDHFRDDLRLGLNVINNLNDAVWNIETLWQLKQWINAHNTKEDRAFLKQVAQTGRLGLGAFYANMHTSLMSSEELFRSLYLAERLRHQLEVPIDTAVVNDVPGFSAFVPQALAHSGVRYLLAGVNVEFGGGLQLPVRHMPFYWAGPDGSRVLTWVTTSGAGYLEGVFYWEIHRGLIELLMEKLKALENRGYPYDAVLIIDGYGDNAGIGSIVSRLDAIKRLQANRLGIEVRYSRIDEFFRYMEEAYGSSFPTYTGDFGRQWEVVRVGGPWQMARLRRFQRLLPAVESLYTLSTLHHDADETNADQLLDRAWELMLVLHEHSAAPGTGWPDHVTRAQTIEDNETKTQYVQDLKDHVGEVIQAAWTALLGQPGDLAGTSPNALSRGVSRDSTRSVSHDSSRSVSHDSSRTLSRAMSSAASFKDGVKQVVAYNPLSWDRRTLVMVSLSEYDTDLIENDVVVYDPQTNRLIPYQIQGDHLVFDSGMVPAMGFKGFVVGPVQDLLPGRAAVQGASNRPSESGRQGVSYDVSNEEVINEDVIWLDSPWYQLQIDAESGHITSIYDKQLDREIVNPRSRYRFNQLLVASHSVDFLGGTPRAIRAAVESVQSIERPDAIGVKIRYRSGTPWVETDVWLSSNEKKFEIQNVLDWNQMRVVPYEEHSDHYYFSFPFDLDRQTLDARYQGAAGFQSLRSDTLPGASANSIISLAAVDLRDDHWGVTIAHREAFAFTIGGTARQGSIFRPGEATLIAHVVQKADEGLTKDQGIVRFDIEPASSGLHAFGFAFTSNEGAFEPVSTYRFGLNWMTPMLVGIAPQDASVPWLGQSVVRVDAPGVVVTALKRHMFQQTDRVVLRLQEIAGESRDVTVTTAFPIVGVTRVNGVERPIGDPIDVGGRVGVRIDVERPAGDPIDVGVHSVRLPIGSYETVTLLLDVGESI